MNFNDLYILEISLTVQCAMWRICRVEARDHE